MIRHYSLHIYIYVLKLYLSSFYKYKLSLSLQFVFMDPRIYTETYCVLFNNTNIISIYKDIDIYLIIWWRINIFYKLYRGKGLRPVEKKSLPPSFVYSSIMNYNTLLLKLKFIFYINLYYKYKWRWYLLNHY